MASICLTGSGKPVAGRSRCARAAPIAAVSAETRISVAGVNVNVPDKTFICKGRGMIGIVSISGDSSL